jgi:hypothetical protein
MKNRKRLVLERLAACGLMLMAVGLGVSLADDQNAAPELNQWMPVRPALPEQETLSEVTLTPLETPSARADTSRRGQVSWAVLEVPDPPRRSSS